jgi:hypothetical protein
MDMGGLPLRYVFDRFSGRNGTKKSHIKHTSFLGDFG